jgi:putative phosphoesterase
VKLFFLSDIHGNHFALEAILKKAKSLNVDQIYCLGDISGYLSGVEKVVNLLKTYNVICISGNHDAFLCGKLTISDQKDYFDAFLHDNNNLLNETRKWFEELPSTLLIDIGSKLIRMYHGGPNDLLNEYIYPDNILKQDIMLQDSIIYLFGHTHLQFVVREGGGIFANPGSVGLARNGDCRAHGLIYDSLNSLFEEVRVLYPLEQAINYYKEFKYINVKYLHNLNFGRSSNKLLFVGSDHFLSNELILELNCCGISILNTCYGAVMSKTSDEFMRNIIYVAAYFDKSVEITSNTLIFNWENKKNLGGLENNSLKLFLVKDNAGLYYKEFFESSDSFFASGLQNIIKAFNEIQLYTNHNVKI